MNTRTGQVRKPSKPGATGRRPYAMEGCPHRGRPMAPSEGRRTSGRQQRPSSGGTPIPWEAQVGWPGLAVSHRLREEQFSATVTAALAGRRHAARVGEAGTEPPAGRLPRTRGDGPRRPRSRTVARWASPHTRGFDHAILQHRRPHPPGPALPHPAARPGEPRRPARSRPRRAVLRTPAPRQTGKTSALLALRDLLNAGSDYRCVYVTVEAGQAARENVADAMRVILYELESEEQATLGSNTLADVCRVRWSAPGRWKRCGRRWPAGAWPTRSRWCC